MIDGASGDITNFYVSLGGLPGDVLWGGVDLTNGVPSGVVQSLDMTEYFNFNCRIAASYTPTTTGITRRADPSRG